MMRCVTELVRSASHWVAVVVNDEEQSPVFCFRDDHALSSVEQPLLKDQVCAS